MYQYATRLKHVVDGDTVDLIVDLGFMVSILVGFRLAGIDAPEVMGESREAGKASKSHLESVLSEAQMGIIRIDSMGRDQLTAVGLLGYTMLTNRVPSSMSTSA